MSLAELMNLAPWRWLIPIGLKNEAVTHDIPIFMGVMDLTIRPILVLSICFVIFVCFFRVDCFGYPSEMFHIFLTPCMLGRKYS